MRIIAVMSPKGGIGKTTTSDSIAYMLGEEQGKRVLVLDGDPQGDTSKTFGVFEPDGIGMSELLEKHECVGGTYKTGDLIRPTEYSHVDIIPANGYLMKTDMNLLLKSEDNQVTRLREALEEVADACDELHFATGAQAMIHKPLCMAYGNADDFKAVIKQLNLCEDSILDVYMEHVQEGVTRDKIQSLMSNETWFDSKKMQQYFNVEIEEKAAVAACASDFFEKYNNIPEALKGIDTKDIVDAVIAELENRNNAAAEAEKQRIEAEKQQILDDLCRNMHGKKEKNYMSWSNKESANASVYTMKWSYCTQQCGNYEANMLHAGADINMHFFTLRNVSFEDGSISGTLTFKQPLEVGSDGKLAKWSTATLEFKRGILVSGTWSNG